MKYTIDDIRERLLDEDYPNNAALLDSVLSQFQSLSREDEAIFNDWFESNRVPQFDINGITPSYLRKYQGMKDAAIVLAYLRLRKDPQAARLLKRPVIKNCK